MPTHVALLRGINVGGRTSVQMADLRETVEGLGHTEVTTYIRSGNVLFTPGRRATTAALAAELARAVVDGLGVPAAVVVLAREELARVVRDNPYPDEPDPTKLHAIFLDRDPEPDFAEAVTAAQQRARAAGSRDSVTLVGRTLFLHTPDGFGRSKLAGPVAGLTNGRKYAAGTSRNWSTVTTLLDMCH